ncbi:MAG: LysR family transcriptional regulator [Pseudomonadota bacterium]|nr:LysR family transcriptional regulator [Pseudomonadota bacterium]
MRDKRRCVKSAVMTARRHLDQRLKIQHFRGIEAIAANGSLLKAAAALGLTQPALSKALREVESIVGKPLFERHSRGVRLTEAGLAARDAARRVIAELRRLDEALDGLDSPGRGVLALGVLPVAASGVLPGALTRLKAAEPLMRVRLEQGRTEELLPLLAAGELDLVVGRLYQPALPDAFVRERLWIEPMSILARAGHPLFDGPRVDADALRPYDLVLPTITQRVGQEVERIIAELGLEAAAAFRSSSYGFIREMLLGGDCVAIMPKLMMVGDLLRGALRLAPLPIEAAERPAGLIRRRDAPASPAAALFVATLRGYVGELAARGLA